MANKKISISLDFTNNLNNSIKQVEELKVRLRDLNVPKEMKLDLSDQIKNFTKQANSLSKMQPNTDNMGAYVATLNKVQEAYAGINRAVSELKSPAQQFALDGKSVDLLKTKYEDLKKTFDDLYGAQGASKKAFENAKNYFNLEDDNWRGQQAGVKKSATKRNLIKQERDEGIPFDSAEYQKHLETLKEVEKAQDKVTNAKAKFDSAMRSNAVVKMSEDLTRVSTSATATGETLKLVSAEVSQMQAEANQALGDQTAENFTNTIKRFTAFGVAVRFVRDQLSQMSKTYQNLDAGLTQIAVVSGRTRDQMWGMVGTYNEMAQKLGTTTEQVIESSKLYFQQGRTQSDVMKLVEQTTVLATISELGFAEATDYMTAAINGFKLSAEDAVNVTDVWANLAAKAAVDTDELAVAISKVASLAEGAGMSIGSTSALLTKMIETTREAPENLGTGLKTIIARFQELKLDPISELEDGVDANKVEKALRTAKVELRDANGEFRDFDDVIMELSKKWDGLSRSQQRYIATIAAGARQQSRFIAMVDGYQRNVQLMDIADSSEGAGLSQFDTQLTSLQASLNKLTAAWEGLYTSIEGGHTIITTLVDVFASVIKVIDKAGIGLTASIGIVALLAIKVGIATIVAEKHNQALLQQAVIQGVVASGQTKNVAGTVAEITANITSNQVLRVKNALLTKQIALTAAVTLGISVLAGLLVAGVAAIVNSTEAIENNIAALEEQARQYEISKARFSQEATGLKTLLTEYNNLVKAGEDVTEIKNQIIEQYPEIGRILENETESHLRLNEVLEEEIRLREYKAAQFGVAQEKNTVDAELAKEKRDLDKSRRELEDRLSTYQQDVAGINATGWKDINNGQKYAADKGYNVFEGFLMDNEKNQKVLDEQDLFVQFQPYWEYDGKEYTSMEELTAAVEEDISGIQTSLEELDNPMVITKKMALDFGTIYAIDSGAENQKLAQRIAQLAVEGFEKDQITEPTGETVTDENGNEQETYQIIKARQDQIDKVLAETAKILENAKEEDRQMYEDFVMGNFEEISQADYAQIRKEQPSLLEIGFEDPATGDTEKLSTKYQNYLKDEFELISESFATFDIDLRNMNVGMGDMPLLEKLREALIGSEGTEFEDEIRSTVERMLAAGSGAIQEAKNSVVVTDENKTSLANMLGLDLANVDDESQAIKDALEKFLTDLDYTNLEDVTGALVMLQLAGADTGELFEILSDQVSETGNSFDNSVDSLRKTAKQMQKVKDALKSVSLSYEEMEDLVQSSDGLLDWTDFDYDAENDVWTGNKKSLEGYLEALELVQQGEMDAANAVIANSNSKLDALNATDQLALSEFMLAINSSIANGTLNAADVTTLIDQFNRGEISAEQLTQKLQDMTGEALAGFAAIGALGDVAGTDAGDAISEAVKTGAAQVQALMAAARSGGSKPSAGKSGGGGGGKGKDAADEALEAEKKYVEQLKKTADQLKKVADEEQKLQEKRIKQIQKVLKEREKALEKENELLEKQIESGREAEEIQLEAFQRYLEKRTKELEKSMEALRKAADKARKAADEDNKKLTTENTVVQKYYKDQIALLDEQIKALNDKAEEEDRLLKLAQARDAYERAKNSKNRLVLVSGAGWVWKRDEDAIEKARQEVEDANKAIKIADLEKEKELLGKQSELWAEKAENIGKTTKELLEFESIYKRFSEMSEADRKLALESFGKQVADNNTLNQKADDADKKVEWEEDEDNLNSIENQIKKLEEWSEKVDELLEKVGMDYDDYIKELKIEDALVNLEKLFDYQPIEAMLPHLENLTASTNAHMQKLLSWGKQIEDNEKHIEAISLAMEEWDKITDDLGKSTSELNEEAALFNKYNAQTTEQLSKGSVVWQQAIADAQNLADMWQRANDAQKAYESAQEAYEAKEAASKGSFANGGVVGFTGKAQMHGTKAKPEVVFNNSQAGALWSFIRGLESNALLTNDSSLSADKQNVVAEDNSITYTNCTFEINTEADSLASLVSDLKRNSPLIEK